MALRLPDTLGTHLEKGLPLVAYRKPGQEVLTILLQGDRTGHRVKDFTESGFVFAPFDPEVKPILLRPDSIIELRFPSGPGDERPASDSAIENAVEKEAYQSLVRAVRDYLAEGNCRKVVVSRSQKVENNTPPLRVFEKLLRKYPDAFCYLWYHPKTGVWTGASPELLLNVEEGVYQTMSLAGTVRYRGEAEPNWGKKEREEQEIVTSFLKDALKDKVDSIIVSGPVTVKAGDVLHLQSRISGKLGGGRLNTIIPALHPSPAVCGLPRQAALEFINRNEGFDRAYYTGYLGELNRHSKRTANGDRQAQLYVNLRCMSLSPGHATIYAGGGITPASSPEAEWEETVNKSGTMLSVLLNSPE